MEQFIKLDSKKLEQSQVADTVSQLERAVVRKRMDLEDVVSTAKTNVNTVSTITSLSSLDSEKWVNNRNEAMNAQHLAEKELEMFNKNFPKD